MAPWPADYTGAWTLASSVTRSGVGLHSGAKVSVSLLPSHEPGIRVSWDGDGVDGVAVTLQPSQVRDSQLCTTLELGERRLATVEHLLAALAGTGLSHVELRVSGGEIPLLDGSALGWVEAIAEAGLVPAETPVRRRRPFWSQSFAIGAPA